jgi:hypothetical protein
LDCTVGAHHGTERAACATAVVRAFDGVITVLVDFCALHLQDFLGASVDTQLTAFAPLKVEFEFHVFLPF